MDTPMLVVPEILATHMELQELQPARHEYAMDTADAPRPSALPWLMPHACEFRLMLRFEASSQPNHYIEGRIYHSGGRWWLNATSGRPWAHDPRVKVWIDEEMAPATVAELARLLECLGVDIVAPQQAS